jgi:hypothetical protein
MPLFLQYDNRELQDGYGAQALRIIGIYSVAKFFRIRYLHNPILHAIEEFSHGYNSEVDSLMLLTKVNKFFDFKSDCKHPTNFREISIRTLTFRTFARHYLRYKFSRTNVILTVLLPFGITNKIPDILDIGARKIREVNRDLLDRRIKNDVVVHVRWGYGWKYSDQNYIEPRHLPFSYYSDSIRVAGKLFFSESPDFKVLVHTDLSRENVIWYPTQENVRSGFGEVIGESNKNGIPIEGYDLEKLLLFPPNVSFQIRYCDDFFETFLDMATSRCLIMANSTFSYLAGLINRDVVIWPAVHRNAPLRRWYQSQSLMIDDSGDLLVG